MNGFAFETNTPLLNGFLLFRLITKVGGVIKMLVANTRIVSQCLRRHMDTKHGLPFDCLVHVLRKGVL